MEYNKKKINIFLPIICMFFIFFIITLTGCDINGTSSPQLFTRSAKNSDIVLDSNLDLSNLGQEFKITPNVDINNLTVRFNFYNSKNTLLKSIDKNLGNVKEGLQVLVSISIVDLGLSVSLNAETVSLTVISGTVSYFT